jgi:hypothetical protein
MKLDKNKDYIDNFFDKLSKEELEEKFKKYDKYSKKDSKKSKFKVGQQIKLRNSDDKGHIVLILNPFSEDSIYYCSMYPGSMPGYEWVSVVDLNGCSIDNNGKVSTLQTLNKFSEEDLEII